MGNVFQRILVFLGFKRTDVQYTPEFTNIASVTADSNGVAASNIGRHVDQNKAKQYSWDKRRAEGPVDCSSWKINGIVDSISVKVPGSVFGNDLDISNCRNSRIYVFDNASQILVDDCTGCKFIFAAVKGNVFFRNCNDCYFIVATSQFRTRDCNSCEFYLYCQTIPIIEASSSLRFHCFQMNYEGIKQQMSAAGLVCFNNNWSAIHDFTPEGGRNNYLHIAPPTNKLGDVFPLENLGESVERLSINFAAESSCIPVTYGHSISGLLNEALIVIDPGITQISFGYALVAQLTCSAQIKLKHTMLHKIHSDDAERIFGNGKLSFESGNILALIISFADGLDIAQSIDLLIDNLKPAFKKLPNYSVFTSKSVIAEILRYAASQISG